MTKKTKTTQKSAPKKYTPKERWEAFEGLLAGALNVKREDIKKHFLRGNTRNSSR
jgi:hypothetical protein